MTKADPTPKAKRGAKAPAKKAAAPSRNLGGRPFALTADAATLKIITGLGQIQAVSKEIAAVLGVSEPTWISFKAKHPEVTEALERGRGNGLASLRRTQFLTANKGNATMQIWLGKQYLGQADKTVHTGTVGTYDLSKVSDDDLSRIAEILSGATPAPVGDQGGNPA